MAPLVRTGGSRHTGLAAPPHRNIHKEAEKISTRPIYDVVIADSVFQYFQSPEYDMSVLKKMWDKAKKIIVITELHDQSMKEQHLNYRRQCVENYDERYRGWIKHFTQKKCS